MIYTRDYNPIILGGDIAREIIETGKAYAEYVAAPASQLALKASKYSK